MLENEAIMFSIYRGDINLLTLYSFFFSVLFSLVTHYWWEK